jgi:hypothetical protein
MASAARWMTGVSGVTLALGPVPDGVEVYPGHGDGKVVYIVVKFCAG